MANKKTISQFGCTFSRAKLHRKIPRMAYLSLLRGIGKGILHNDLYAFDASIPFWWGPNVVHVPPTAQRWVSYLFTLILWLAAKSGTATKIPPPGLIFSVPVGKLPRSWLCRCNLRGCCCCCWVWWLLFLLLSLIFPSRKAGKAITDHRRHWTGLPPAMIRVRRRRGRRWCLVMSTAVLRAVTPSYEPTFVINSMVLFYFL